MNKRPNEPLSRHCWNQLGGPAQLLIDVENDEELRSVLTEASTSQTTVRILGLGSNLMVAQEGVRGVVIRLTGEFATYSFDGETLTAGAGVDLRKVVSESVRQGRDGFWQLAGFPATIGGAIAMNAGGRWGEIGDILTTCEGYQLNGTPWQQTAADCGFSYRHSEVPGVITKATFTLKAGEPKLLRAKLKEVMSEKAAAQPLGAKTPSSGCSFRNPTIQGVRHSAGQLIDQAGGKGLSVGGAMVSPTHANFIVTTPTATASDVAALMGQVQKIVAQHHSVLLEPEVIQWPEPRKN